MLVDKKKAVEGLKDFLGRRPPPLATHAQMLGGALEAERELGSADRT
jgi:hypothetical protein